MAATDAAGGRIAPAHVSSLAIYNPSFGSSDETVRDQIVFYYAGDRQSSRDGDGDGRDTRRDESPSGGDFESADGAGAARSEENERLRQVGLAQGIVNLSKDISDGHPVESIETEQSRIVVKELEPGWWIVAAVALTRIPSASATSTTKPAPPNDPTSKEQGQMDPAEYSSREVAASHLLLANLERAYRGFLLHHAASLADLWKRHETHPAGFRTLLHSYWSRFVANWDVLLHGHPTAELYGATKLAGGGELGIGVGEEEWGSGEREVLEGFVDRTEGLLDLVVGRYGDAPAPSDGSRLEDRPATDEWLGNGDEPRAQDGIIFSGTGALSRRCLVTISQWMEDVYVHGEQAYGVGQNPISQPRHRTRRKGGEKRNCRGDASASRIEALRPGGRIKDPPRLSPPRKRALNLRREAIDNNNTARPGPGIPPPLVSAVERSLDAASAKAGARISPRPTDEAPAADDASESASGSGPSNLFGTDKVMKFLSFGYGSSWTLAPRGFGSETPPVDDPANVDEETASDDPTQALDSAVEDAEGTDASFLQRMEPSAGNFLIGLTGDLENMEFEAESPRPSGTADANIVEPTVRESSRRSAAAAGRIILRTLQVDVSVSRSLQMLTSRQDPGHSTRHEVDLSPGQAQTSASASIDGGLPMTSHLKVQVIVYVHQPFIFVFLFQPHSTCLTMPSFYRAIHHTLGPLQNSLLKSTDAERWRERMGATLDPASSPLPDHGPDRRASNPGNDMTEIYDLIYDPVKLTVRTSIPNIPYPGSLAAEGLHRAQQPLRPITVSGSWYTLGIPVGSSSMSTSGKANAETAGKIIKSEWTRVEALSVHTHLLNTWEATRQHTRISTDRRDLGGDESERTVKTSRGWWLVWMRVRSPGRGAAGGGLASARRGDATGEIVLESAVEAILVRRSPHERSSTAKDSRRSRSESRSSSLAGRWLLREQGQSSQATHPSRGDLAAGSSPTNMANPKGVGEGLGVDARKWVEGLMKLSI